MKETKMNIKIRMTVENRQRKDTVLIQVILEHHTKRHLRHTPSPMC